MPLVRINPGEVTIKVPDGITFRDAIINAGIEIYSPCGGMGICGKCGAKIDSGKINGEVDENGNFLTCSSVPLSDCEIEISPIPDDEKAEKAFSIKGPAVLNILTPCILFWKVPTDSAVQLSKLAYETNFWPLYEVENGKYTLNYNPPNRKPITEWMKPQGRYAHLLLPENKALLDKIQKYYDDEFEKLKKKCGVK